MKKALIYIFFSFALGLIACSPVRPSPPLGVIQLTQTSTPLPEASVTPLSLTATIEPTASVTEISELDQNPEVETQPSSTPTEMQPSFPALEMESVSLPDQGFDTIVPAGWEELEPGYYVSPDESVELLFNDVRSQDLDEFLAVWGAQSVVDAFERNGFLWEVRAIDLPDYDYAGLVATSNHDQGFYMVLVATNAEQAVRMQETVFYPVVRAFQLIGMTSETEEVAVNEETPETPGETNSPEATNTLEPVVAEATSGPSATPTNTPPPSMTPTPTRQPVQMVEFENEDLNLTGLAPEGWLELQRGVFTRAQGYNDPTLLIQKSYPDLNSVTLLTVLLPSLGISVLPEPFGELSANAFNWDLYQTNVTAADGRTLTLDLALAERGGVPYLVLLQAEASEHEDLLMLEEIFFPAVRALAPMK